MKSNGIKRISNTRESAHKEDTDQPTKIPVSLQIILLLLLLFGVNCLRWFKWQPVTVYFVVFVELLSVFHFKDVKPQAIHRTSGVRGRRLN